MNARLSQRKDKRRPPGGVKVARPCRRVNRRTKRHARNQGGDNAEGHLPRPVGLGDYLLYSPLKETLQS